MLEAPTYPQAADYIVLQPVADWLRTWMLHKGVILRSMKWDGKHWCCFDDTGQFITRLELELIERASLALRGKDILQMHYDDTHQWETDLTTAVWPDSKDRLFAASQDPLEAEWDKWADDTDDEGGC